MGEAEAGANYRRSELIAPLAHARAVGDSASPQIAQALNAYPGAELLRAASGLLASGESGDQLAGCALAALRPQGCEGVAERAAPLVTGLGPPGGGVAARAHDTLKQASFLDHGRQAGAWRDWLAGLDRPGLIAALGDAAVTRLREVEQ